MSETPAEQRLRLARKRTETVDDDLVKCLECGLRFVRVGSHVVQVHGYESADDYRREHGLNRKEMSAPKYKQKMARLVTEDGTIKNLASGKGSRFRKGGNHGQQVREYWERRRRYYENAKQKG